MGNFPAENEGKFLGEERTKSISSESPKLWRHPGKATEVQRKGIVNNGNVEALLG